MKTILETYPGFQEPLELSTCRTLPDSFDTALNYRSGVKIIREGSDYYLIHGGEILKFLGTGRPTPRDGISSKAESRGEEERASAISDRILFFLGDLETAFTAAKRVRM